MFVSIARCSAICLALILPACWSSPASPDSTVLVHSRDGLELGVATDLGVVFLGQGQRSGEVEYTVFFGDGPSVERATIEPLSTGLYALQPELHLPTVPIGYPVLSAGDSVLVRGHDGREMWERTAQVATNPRVEGMLLVASGLGDLRNDDAGAGVYVSTKHELVLVGLVQGRVTLPVDGGGQREYVAVAGARELLGLGLRGRSSTPHKVPADRHDALQ